MHSIWPYFSPKSSPSWSNVSLSIPCLTKISPSIKLGPTKSGDRSASCHTKPDMVVLSWNISKWFQTYPNTWSYGLLFAKKKCSQELDDIWVHIHVPFNCLYYTNNLHDLHCSVTAGMDLQCPSVTYWRFKIGPSVQHTSLKVFALQSWSRSPKKHHCHIALNTIWQCEE